MIGGLDSLRLLVASEFSETSVLLDSLNVNFVPHKYKAHLWDKQKRMPSSFMDSYHHQSVEYMCC